MLKLPLKAVLVIVMSRIRPWLDLSIAIMNLSPLLFMTAHIVSIRFFC